MYDEGRELDVKADELIVSMTDARGVITYVNDIFCELAGYRREEVVGQPHNIIRHPGMPRAVFKLLWNRVKQGEVIYAFVKNKAKNGDYYWVKAYVVPVMNNGQVDKVISYRKPISAYTKEQVSALYAQLSEYERSHSADESLAFFTQYLNERNLSYDIFMERLSEDKQVTNIAALQVNTARHHNAHTIVQANVKSRVENGERGISVVDSCCCDFGKWCDSVKHESFTKHGSWRNVLNHHDAMHQKLKSYVHHADQGKNSRELEHDLGDIAMETKMIFEALDDVIDHCA